MKIRILILVAVAVGLAFTPFSQGLEHDLVKKPNQQERNALKSEKSEALKSSEVVI